MIVDNRPGAGGMLGVRMGVAAKPDGYTLTLISNSYTVNPSLYKLAFDPVADITPIAQIAQGPFVVVAGPGLPAKSIAEVIALAKAKPGEIKYASSGQGSIPHLATELLASMAGIKLTHVPYRGGGPALTDTIAGRIGLFLSPTSTAIQHVKAGTLRALAVTTATRSPAFPDVPTVAESGVPGYDVMLWHGIIGPKGLPAPIVARLNHEIDAIVHSKEAAAVLERDGVAPAGGPPERLQRWSRARSPRGTRSSSRRASRRSSATPWSTSSRSSGDACSRSRWSGPRVRHHADSRDRAAGVALPTNASPRVPTPPRPRRAQAAMQHRRNERDQRDAR